MTTTDTPLADGGLSPTLLALRDAIADPRPAELAEALADARVLLAAHARELAECVRSSDRLRDFTDDHMSDMDEAAAELGRYADGLDLAAVDGEQPTPAWPDAAAILRVVSDWCIEANDSGGVDAGDLAWRLEQAGYPLPDDEDGDDQ